MISIKLHEEVKHLVCDKETLQILTEAYTVLVTGKTFRYERFLTKGDSPVCR